MITSPNITSITEALDNKANSNHSHTSSNITDLNNLKNDIFKMIYPIGSIYITMSKLTEFIIPPIDPGDEPPTVDEGHVIWNDCEWQLLSSGLFLRNVDTSFDANIHYFTVPDHAGNLGGSETHTHATKDHKLTIGELPPHNHDIINNYGSEVVGKYGWAFTHTGPHDSVWSGLTTENTGSGIAHNHGDTYSASSLPPYVTCYMYRRIG